MESALSGLHWNGGSSRTFRSNNNPLFSLTDSSDESTANKEQHHHNYRMQHHYVHHTPLNSLPPTTTHAPTVETHHSGGLYLQLTEQQIATAINARLCLGLDDIFIALFLVGFLL